MIVPWYHDRSGSCCERIQSFLKVELQFEESFSDWNIFAGQQTAPPENKKYIILIPENNSFYIHVTESLGVIVFGNHLKSANSWISYDIRKSAKIPEWIFRFSYITARLCVFIQHMLFTKRKM